MATKEKPASAGKAQIKEVYGYRNEAGELVYEVVRYEPKNFRQRRPVNGKARAWGRSEGWYKPDATGDYSLIKDAPADPDKSPSKGAVWLEKVEPVPYKLPEVIRAIRDGKTIFIAEGEKDADCLSGLGYTATTNPMGAGKWRRAYTQALKGCKDAVIIADKDKKGRDHAEDVAGRLAGTGIKVKVVEMPDRGEAKVKDFSDWVVAGGTREEFDKMVADAPVWQGQIPDESAPAEPHAADDNLPAVLVDQYGTPYYLNKYGEVSSLNEAFFAALHHFENIELYEPVERAFYRYAYENGLYSEITEHVIKREIAGRILRISREHDCPSLERQKRNAVLVSITANLKGIAEKRSAFVKKEHFVHLGNVVLVFKSTGEVDVTGFSPSFYSRNQSPIHYNPKATCERFLNEFLYPAVHEEDAVLLQKYAGLCILGNNIVQRFLILDGMSGRGKSTLSLIIQRLVGLPNVTELRTRHLSERFEMFRYLKKTLLTGVDVPGNFLSQRGAHKIKGLVGADVFDAEQKCGTGSFQLQGCFSIVITSNSRLRVKLDGDLGAWRRRLLIVRFETLSPTKKIPNFADHLIEQEGSGILNWALQGLAMLLDDIRKCGDIQLGAKQIAIVDALLAESDSIRHFLNDRIVADALGDLSVQEIVEAYAEYCPTRGWESKPITVVYRELDSLMLELFHVTKSHSVRRDDKDVRGFNRVGFKDGLEVAR